MPLAPMDIRPGCECSGSAYRGLVLATSLSIGLSALVLGQAPPAPLPADQVARVADAPITRADYKHWLRIARRSEPRGRTEAQLRPLVMESLIAFRWIEGEAALEGIKLTTKRVNAEYRRQKRERFASERDFKRYLRLSGMTVADYKLEVRARMLGGRLMRRAIGDAKTPRGISRRADRFFESFEQRWRDLTVCHEDFDAEDSCGTLVGSA
jgi:hypothetical protein